jgi:hypothetical protein
MTDLDHVQESLLAAKMNSHQVLTVKIGGCFQRVLYHFGESQFNKECTRRSMSSPAVHVDLAKVVLVSNASRSSNRLVFPVGSNRDVSGAIGMEGALATRP